MAEGVVSSSKSVVQEIFTEIASVSAKIEAVISEVEYDSDVIITSKKLVGFSRKSTSNKPREVYDELKVSVIFDALSYVLGAAETKLIVAPNTQTGWMRGPYYFVMLNDFGKKVMFSPEVEIATYVIDIDKQIHGEIDIELKEDKLVFHKNKYPNLLKFKLIKLISDLKFDEIKESLLDEIRNFFNDPEDFLRTGVEELSRIEFSEVSLAVIAREVFDLDFVGYLDDINRLRLAKIIWEDLDLENLSELKKEDIIFEIKKSYRSIDEFMGENYQEFCQFSIAGRKWKAICSALNVDLNPMSNYEERLELGILIYDEEYEVESANQIVEQVKKAFEPKDFLKIPIRKFLSYKFGKNNVSFLMLAKMLGSDLGNIPNARVKAQVGVLIWGDLDIFKARLMGKEEWSSYLYEKYTSHEFEHMGLNNLKEMGVSYHLITQAMGMTKKPRTINEMRKFILDFVWPESE